jgi:WD40 repeat protein
VKARREKQARGWTLESDPEADRHWDPRGRGVGVASERGDRFQGRSAALHTITEWLGRPRPDRRVLVVTGQPGAGKSAVLARVVMTTDDVMCAVHCRGKTALDVATEIAIAAGVPRPDMVEDLAPAIRRGRAEADAERFNVVIDALDEADDPTQTRILVANIVLPLVQTCADLGVQVVLGTRRYDNGGDLLSLLGRASHVVDLDAAKYFEPDDLVAYALASLRLVGDERPGSGPYAEDEAALPVAQSIAATAGQNFLIAGLVARMHGLYDEEPVEPAELGDVPDIRVAFDRYLAHLPDVAGLPARTLLTALAFAESPGFTADLWRIAIRAVDGAEVGAMEIRRFARSSAANFLVVTEDSEKTFRLFHQALNEELLASRARVSAVFDDEAAIARAFIALGRERNWAGAPPYLYRSLAGHAQRAGLIDGLVADLDFLVHAEPSRLVVHLDEVSSPEAMRLARAYRTSLHLDTEGDPDRRRDHLIVDAARWGLHLPEACGGGDWSIRWATGSPLHGAFQARLAGEHEIWTKAACAEVDGRPVVVTAGYKRIRIWDPYSGTLLREATHPNEGPVWDLAMVGTASRALAITARNGTAVVWDLATLTEVGRLDTGDTDGRASVIVAELDGTPWALTPGSHGVRRWRLDDLSCVDWCLDGDKDVVEDLAVSNIAGRAVLITLSKRDGRLRLWDLASGEPIGDPFGEGAYQVRATTVRGAPVAVVAVDGGVQVWDIIDRRPAGPVLGDVEFVTDLTTATIGGQDTVIVADNGRGEDGLGYEIDSTVRVWDLATGTALGAPLTAHYYPVHSVAATTVDGHCVAATVGNDAIRVWHLSLETLTAVPAAGHTDPVNRVVTATTPAGSIAATVGYKDGNVRIWDLSAPHASCRIIEATDDSITAVDILGAGDTLAVGASHADESAIGRWSLTTLRQIGEPMETGGTVLTTGFVGGRTIAICHYDDSVGAVDVVSGEVLWDADDSWLCEIVEWGGRPIVAMYDGVLVTTRDLLTGQPFARSLECEGQSELTIAAGEADGTFVVALVGDDGVRAWDLRTGRPLGSPITGYDADVHALALTTVDERPAVMTGDRAGTVQIRDLLSGRPLRRTLHLPGEIHALARADTGDIVIGLDRDILVAHVAPGSLQVIAYAEPASHVA